MIREFEPHDLSMNGKNTVVSSEDFEKMREVAFELAKACTHPDINELNCDCGYFEEGMHVCIKHYNDICLDEARKLLGEK